MSIGSDPAFKAKPVSESVSGPPAETLKHTDERQFDHKCCGSWATEKKLIRIQKQNLYRERRGLKKHFVNTGKLRPHLLEDCWCRREKKYEKR